MGLGKVKQPPHNKKQIQSPLRASTSGLLKFELNLPPKPTFSILTWKILEFYHISLFILTLPSIKYSYVLSPLFYFSILNPFTSLPSLYTYIHTFSLFSLKCSWRIKIKLWFCLVSCHGKPNWTSTRLHHRCSNLKVEEMKSCQMKNPICATGSKYIQIL